MKKYIVSLIVLIIFAMPCVFAFDDLPETHWAFNCINEMVEKGVFIGYPDGTFQPSGKITRAEFAKVMVVALEVNGTLTPNYTDVDTTFWAHDYIAIASRYLAGYTNKNGIQHYSPNEPAIREDIAKAMVILQRLDTEEPRYQLLDKFTDKDLISEENKKYVAIAVRYSIMSGNGDGTFNPQGTLTRAEASKLMQNMIKLNSSREAMMSVDWLSDIKAVKRVIDKVMTDNSGNKWNGVTVTNKQPAVGTAVALGSKVLEYYPSKSVISTDYYIDRDGNVYSAVEDPADKGRYNIDYKTRPETLINE